MSAKRRTLAMVGAAFAAGFLVASVSAFAYTKYPPWRDFGDLFQLGYVVGFLDAAKLSKYRDARGAMIPAGGKPNFQEWVADVNEFFKDPKNQHLEVVDALAFVGTRITYERMEAFRKRNERTPAPRPSPS